MQSSISSYFTQKKKKDINDNQKTSKKQKSSRAEETEIEKAEEKLVAFDLDPQYGPCKGMTRSERFNSCVKLNLNPPPEIELLINKYKLEKSYYDRHI